MAVVYCRSMGTLYKSFVKPLFFKMSPEQAHEVAVDMLRILSRTPGLASAVSAFNSLPSAAEPVDVFGLRFPNRIGLAAGFDKNAVCWEAFRALGFGHVEAGTLTFKAQPGNPKPRLFRFPEQEAVLNRMGFNNHGAQFVAARLSRRGSSGKMPLGLNIGKSKITPLDEAVDDYLQSFSLLADFADYVAINVSSPNTPDLRRLQEESRLRVLLEALAQANKGRDGRPGKSPKPILLKIAPDLDLAQLDEILQILMDLEFDGIIATNTTMAREGPFRDLDEPGGISGKPVEEMSTGIVARIASLTGGKLPIIGVGGVSDPDSAARKIDAGATLVQVYSALIYEGPFLGKRIARSLARHCGDLA